MAITQVRRYSAGGLSLSVKKFTQLSHMLWYNQQSMGCRQMNFRREKINNLYLSDTQVENIFLTEYMPEAEGDFVKVYLTALMYAGDEKMSNSLIAKHLGMEEEDVLRAWNYWESCGVIRKRGVSDDRFHYTVEFTCLKEKLFLSPGETEEEASEEIPEDFSLRMNDEELRKTFDSVEEITGRMLESRESSAIVSWICEEGLSPDLIRFAYRFCAEKRGNSRFPYVSSVIRDWERENIRTSEEAEKYLEDTDLRHNQYRRVMKALGFHRNPTEKEQDIMDTWFDQMGFDIGKILEACAKTSGISKSQHQLRQQHTARLERQRHTECQKRIRCRRHGKGRQSGRKGEKAVRGAETQKRG